MIHFSQLLFCRSWHLDAEIWASTVCSQHITNPWHWTEQRESMSTSLNTLKTLNFYLHAAGFKPTPQYSLSSSLLFLFFWLQKPGILDTLVRLINPPVSPVSHILLSKSPSFSLDPQAPPPSPVEAFPLCSQSRQLGGALPYDVTWVPSGVS